jgi:hypothetical protein
MYLVKRILKERKMMKLIVSYQVKEFTYKSKTSRDYHVSEMEEEGWNESGRVKRLKEDVNILTATENEYEWFANFQRYDV